MRISYGKDHTAQKSFKEQIVLQLWINRAHSRVVQGFVTYQSHYWIMYRSTGPNTAEMQFRLNTNSQVNLSSSLNPLISFWTIRPYLNK